MDKILEARQKCVQAELLLNQARFKNSDQQLIHQAIELYEDVLAMPGVNIADPYLGMAYLVFSAGQKENALALLNTARKLEPANMRVTQMISRLEKAQAVEFPKTDWQKVHSHRAAAADKDQVPVSQPHQVASEPEGPPTTITQMLGPKGSGKCHDGPQVELLQQWLRHLKYHQVNLTGQFDKTTLAAVQAFQMAQKLRITGIVDVRMADLLLQQVENTPATSVEDEDECLPDIPDNLTEILYELGTERGQIKKGSQIRLLQQALAFAGFDKITISDVFDKPTYLALRSFQSQHKLPVTGVTDSQTRTVLNEVLKRLQQQDATAIALIALLNDYRQTLLQEPLSEVLQTHLLQQFQRLWSLLRQPPDLLTNIAAAVIIPPPAPRPHLSNILGTAGQAGVISSGPEVTCLQEILVGLGYSLTVNDTFDLQTFTALKQFQQEHVLESTGLVDADTRALINLDLQARYDRENILDELQNHIRDYCKEVSWPEPDDRFLYRWSHKNVALAVDEITLAEALKPEIKELYSDLGMTTRPGMVNQGLEVELLQYMLTQLGLPVTVSGHYDDATGAAVRQFQTRQKLAMTGWVDEKTRQLLNTSYQQVDLP